MTDLTPELSSAVVRELDTVWGIDNLIDINVEEPEDYLLILGELIAMARRTAEAEQSLWWGVWAEQNGANGFWLSMAPQSRDRIETTQTEALRIAAARNASSATRIDSLGWSYEVRPIDMQQRIAELERRLTKAKGLLDAILNSFAPEDCSGWRESRAALDAQPSDSEDKP